MSLRTKSRMPASTSETAARLESSSGDSIDSIFSERMTVIGCSPVSRSDASVPRTTKVAVGLSGLPILTASGPICGNARSLLRCSGTETTARRYRRSPAALESGGEALVGGAQRRLADRARYADAVEQFLFGADLAQPFVVGGGKLLAGDQAGAGVGDAQPGRLLGLVASRWPRDDAGHREDALLGDIVAVLQGQRILIAERQQLAQGRAELAVFLAGVDAGFDRGLVPDRSDARGGHRGPCGPGGLRRIAAIGGFFRQQLRHRRRLRRDRHVGADSACPERRERLLHRDAG